MRAFEFVSAEDSLKLLNTIFDKAFSEIDAQAQQQAREAMATATKPKQKKKRKRSVRSFKAPPMRKGTNPYPKPQPKAQLPSAQQKLAQPNNSAAPRLNNAPFGSKSHFSDDDNII